MKYILLATLFISLSVSSQNEANKVDDRSRFVYDKDLLTKEFHRARRDSLRNLLPDSSVAVFFANPVRNRANDVDFQFHQDPNFYYLTGLREPDAMVLIFKEKISLDSFETDEIIFVQPLDPSEEVWLGRRYGTQGVKDILGFSNVFENKEFSAFTLDFNRFKKVYSITPEDDVRDDKSDRGDLYSLVNHFRLKTEKHKSKNNSWGLSNMMAKLREIKTPEELVLLKKAVEISCQAHKEMIRAVHGNMTEYEAQAIIEYGFKFRGAEYTGYPSIVGSGENSCILHYSTNRRPFSNKDMVLVDAGAEYHGYTADITRTVPTDGKFSEEEKAIYNIVLEAQEAGIKKCRAGAGFREPDVAAREVIAKRLKELSIIKSEFESMTYFNHGTSHYLGLDVHDPGTYGKLKPNSVITVEPGVYIPEGSNCDPRWWNIGVRIEDDILITTGDPVNLSISIPRTIEEVEKLMEEESVFNKLDKE